MNIDMYVYMMFCDCVRHEFTRVYVGIYGLHVYICIYIYMHTNMCMHVYIGIFVSVCIWI